MQRWKEIIRRFLFWIGAAILLIGIIGCGKKAESAQAGKQADTAQMMQTAESNDGVWIADLHAPREYTAEFSYGNPSLTVRVHADVIVPNAQAIPVCRVAPGKITQDVVDRVCRMFLADAAMYKEKDYLVTDETWDGKLYENERGIPGGGAGTERFLGVQAAEARGRLLDRSLFVWNESDFRNGLRVDDPDGGSSITPAHSGAKLRYIDNRQSKQHGAHWQIYKDVTDAATVDEAATGALSMTPAEAAMKAQAVFDELGLPVQLESVWLCTNGAMERSDDGTREFINTPKQFCYKARFVHNTIDVPNILLSSATEITDEVGDVLWTWSYGTPYLYLDDEGIFELGYYAPLDITEKVSEDVQLLPFDEIMEVFERMLPAVYQYGRFEPFDSKKLEINRITLGMMRLSDQGSIESGTLVPAWSFYGTENTVYSAMSNREQDDLYRIGLPFLIINAIDGSVIDIVEGY